MIREIPEINRCYPGDCIAVMKNLWPDNFIDCVMTSPPYPGASMWDYIPNVQELFEESLRLSCRKLKPGGVLVWNVHDIPAVGNHLKLSLNVMRSMEIAVEEGMNLYNEIVWDRGVGRLGFPHFLKNPVIVTSQIEFILVFIKGERVPRSDRQLNQLERSWAFSNVWRITPVVAKDFDHICPFPLEIPIRCLSLFSIPGDLVLDPFMGSFTTAIAAAKLKRNWLGIELEQKYIETGEKRLAKEGIDEYELPLEEKITQGSLF